jgi:hypothetical protein
MTLHKLSAGSGYEYLTRQVAALDSTEKGLVPLADITRPRVRLRVTGSVPVLAASARNTPPAPTAASKLSGTDAYGSIVAGSRGVACSSELDAADIELGAAPRWVTCVSADTPESRKSGVR